MTMTRTEINALWNQGYRAWEIYVCNDGPVEYCGKTCAAGEVTGWEIELVVAKRDELPAYPYFDAIIDRTDFSAVEYLWKNGERIDLKGRDRINIQPIGIINTPESWEQLSDWIEAHSPSERAQLLTAAGMAWNLAAKLTKVEDLE